MGTVLLGAPLLWTVLPVPWAARAVAVAIALLAAVTVWHLGPHRVSGSGPTRTRSARPGRRDTGDRARAGRRNSREATP